MVDGHIKVGDGLRLHALRGIHHQQRALAGRNAAADLVAEIYVARSVDKVEDILLSIAHILHLNGVTLDGDTALALQVHVIEHLPFRHLNGVGTFQQTVGECALTVVDMSDDTEVANVFHGRKGSKNLRNSINPKQFFASGHKKIPCKALPCMGNKL